MIRHSAIFKLKYAAGSAAEKAFLEAAAKLKNIPGVERFEVLKQISAKNKFDFGLSMEFADQKQYDGYNTHPGHQAFLRDFWKKGVEDFLEIDYQLLNQYN